MVRRRGRATAALAALSIGTASPLAYASALRQLVELADISGLAASPDGRWIAYRIERPSVDTDTIALDWYVAPADRRAAPRRVASGGTALWDGAGNIEPGHAVWLPDSSAFLVRALVDGAVGVWVMEVGGGRRAGLLAAGNVERFALSGEGRLIYRLGAAREAVERAETVERDDGILIDGQVDLAQTLYRGAIIDGRPASQRWQGTWFARTPLVAGSPAAVRSRDLATGGDREATPIERTRLDTSLSASTPSASVPAVTTAATEWWQSNCTANCGAPGKPQISSSLRLRDGRIALTMQDAALAQRLFVWDERSGSLALLAESAGLLNGGRKESSRCAVGIEDLFCVEAAANIAPRLVRIPLDGGARAIVDTPNPDPVGDPLLAEAIDLRVSGSRASGWLFRPKIPGRLPLFITYYRCPGYLRGGLGDEWPLRTLAAHGIAALCLNALPFADDKAVTRYETGLAVVRAAIAALDRRGLVDPAKVGMGGLSFGSEVAMWTAMQSRLLAAVSIASVQIEPAYYWFNALGDNGRFRPNLLRYWQLGRPDRDIADWRKLSPALNAERIDAPVLMQLPEHEARLSPELHARLIAARKGELHAFPLAPHIKVSPRQKRAAYARNLDWFRFWLQGYTDPNPGKAAQYARWRQLIAAHPMASSSRRSHSSRSAISISR